MLSTKERRHRYFLQYTENGEIHIEYRYSMRYSIFGWDAASKISRYYSGKGATYPEVGFTTDRVKEQGQKCVIGRGAPVQQ